MHQPAAEANAARASVHCPTEGLHRPLSAILASSPVYGRGTAPSGKESSLAFSFPSAVLLLPDARRNRGGCPVMRGTFRAYPCPDCRLHFHPRTRPLSWSHHRPLSPPSASWFPQPALRSTLGLLHRLLVPQVERLRAAYIASRSPLQLISDLPPHPAAAGRLCLVILLNIFLSG